MAVAEPRRIRRDRFAAAHALRPDTAVDDWRVPAARARLAGTVEDV